MCVVNGINITSTRQPVLQLFNCLVSFERSDFGRANIPVSLSEKLMYSTDVYTVVESGQHAVEL
jgi:hypothetical protein